MIRIHILNVGHGDCVVVEFPSGRLTVVDINRSNEMDKDSFAELLAALKPLGTSFKVGLYESGILSCGDLLKSIGYTIDLTDPIPYIKSLVCQPNTSEVFRFISTHSHIHHLTGFYDLYQEIGITNAWILPGACAQDLSLLRGSQQLDWGLYELFRNDEQQKVKTIRNFAGGCGNFWTEDGIRILAPDHNLFNAADMERDSNGMSYVILITHGTSKVILGGDAEEATWDYVVEHYGDAIRGVQLLKAAHHGRESGYHHEAVRLMRPQYTAVSVGKNPKTDASNIYHRYSDHVVSTRWHGTMIFELDESGNITFRPLS